MIFADLHGKLGSNAERAQPNSEDLLTSTAFGLLRYLPFSSGFGHLFQRARTARLVNGDCQLDRGPPAFLSFTRFSRATLEFWPRLGDAGEPDLRIELGDETGRGHTVLVEVKLHSPKSQRPAKADPTGPDEPEDEGPGIEPDQLARYWSAQRASSPAEIGVTIIYLTAHATAPISDLRESLCRNPRMDLAWLSWRDVWAVANRVAETQLPADDLARLLRSKHLSNFDGFRGAMTAVPAIGSFWRGPTTAARRSSTFFMRTQRLAEHLIRCRSGMFFTKGNAQ